VQNKWKYQSLLQNSVTEFFSRISMEIYLSHMVIFRVFEKLGINKMFGNGILQYVFTVAIVILGASIFAVAMQKIIAVMEQWIQKKA
jgi:peptidoglycan/LPS O-acetylase OafA/YrhL